jgi:predicted phosphodiesterase
MIDDRVEICHGAPHDEDHYIFDADDAQRAMDTSERQLCLFGHTHLPVVQDRRPHVRGVRAGWRRAAGSR